MWPLGERTGVVRHRVLVLAERKCVVAGLPLILGNERLVAVRLTAAARAVDDAEVVVWVPSNLTVK